MSLQQWFRPPRHLLVLFVSTMLAFLGGLGWIGWRAIRDFEDDERRFARERLEEAATTAAAALGRELAEIESQLARLASLRTDALDQSAGTFAAALGDDALVAVFGPETVRGYPPNRLIYYPVLAIAEEPYVHTVIPGRLQSFGGDPAATTLLYLKEMAASDDAQVRAEGLLGLAEHQVRAGQPDAALAAYAALRDPSVLVDGRPAELVARIERCELLKQRGRDRELADEARRLNDDLHRGRWQLTWEAFEHYTAQAQGWLGVGGPSGAEAHARALADAVRVLWDQWQEARERSEPFASRTSGTFRNRPVFMVWRGAEDRAVVLVGGPQYVQRQLVEPLRTQILEPRNVRIGLSDGAGPVVSPGEAGSGPSPVALPMDDTRLPWTVRAVSADPGVDTAQLVTRQRLLIAGIALLALIVVAGTYFSARAMTRELEAARLQSDFVAAVSHEFRTPLTLLRQFSDLLADGRVASDDERRMYYAALQRGTRRLTRLVEDLLDFARMEAGSRAFRREPVDARRWLTRVVEDFAEESRNKGYQVEFGWSGACSAIIQADDGALTRALWNLLDNAVKYSPDCKTIWVHGNAGPDAVTVRVQDRGVGVPASEQRAIFRKFVRGSGPDAHVVKGTGLGLALVEQIVEAHGGTVHLDSTVGEGSTFTMRLPARVEEQVA